MELMRRMSDDLRIAVLIPCHNEELSISEVVSQFRRQLPQAGIYVGDNNSSDQTVEYARAAGAHVRLEPQLGKGRVIQAMLSWIEADIYVMVDGDGTYPPDAVHQLLEPLCRREAEMVVGSRFHALSRSRMRRLNRLGNRFFLLLFNLLFGTRLTDLLSGYRAISREAIKALRLTSGGFELETELTIRALESGGRIVEVPVSVRPRAEGSRSKIRIGRDGVAILALIVRSALGSILVKGWPRHQLELRNKE